MTRIIIINPNNRTVTEATLEPSTDSHAADIHKIIGGHLELACYIRIGANTDIMYVDAEGLFKANKFFVLLGHGHQAFAGIGVITGFDDQGETISAHADIDEIKNKVVF